MGGEISGFPFGHPIQSGFWVALLAVAVMVLGGMLTLMGQWALKQVAQVREKLSSQRWGMGDRPIPTPASSPPELPIKHSSSETIAPDCEFRDKVRSSDAPPDEDSSNLSPSRARLQRFNLHASGSNGSSAKNNTDSIGAGSNGVGSNDADSKADSNRERNDAPNGSHQGGQHDGEPGGAIAQTQTSPDGLHRRSLQPQNAPKTTDPSSRLPRINRDTSSRNGISDSGQLTDIFLNFVKAHQLLLIVAFVLLGVDLLLLITPRTTGRLIVEVPLGLGAAIALAWLSSRLFRDIFDIYLLDTALREGRKLNSEFLILGKVAANGVIVLAVVSIFAQTHNINIFGLIASLGIGGLAVAFAAQKTLEQLLGGVVLYLDRPFMVDDYIGLPDGTFGRVESIGLRSTKVRLSGKGTLMVVPNSSLTQMNIENFTGAKKVMAILYLDLYQVVSDDEMALIRQVILESTSDIFGIDSRSTDVTFRPMPGDTKRTQVQVTFFILGSGEVSMELRRQVLDLANQNITQRLTDYGLRFDIDEPTIYVDAPITI